MERGLFAPLPFLCGVFLGSCPGVCALVVTTRKCFLRDISQARTSPSRKEGLKGVSPSCDPGTPGKSLCVAKRAVRVRGPSSGRSTCVCGVHRGSPQIASVKKKEAEKNVVHTSCFVLSKRDEIHGERWERPSHRPSDFTVRGPLFVVGGTAAEETDFNYASRPTVRQSGGRTVRGVSPCVRTGSRTRLDGGTPVRIRRP